MQTYANQGLIAQVHANLGCLGMTPLKSTPIWDGYRRGVGLPRFASGCESLFVPQRHHRIYFGCGACRNVTGSERNNRKDGRYHDKDHRVP